MKIFRHKTITKSYALKAALYRRLARKQGIKLDFSEQRLIEMFEFESLGAQGRLFSELKTKNGFAYGKWLRDLDVSQMVGDIRAGDFCKIEFLSTAIERLHNKKPLSFVPATEWFPWRLKMANV